MSTQNFPLRPLRDRVLVKPDEAEKKTAGGIIVPDTVVQKPQTGTVVASGVGYTDMPNETKPGDKVMYGKYAGTEIEYAGEQYVIMKESDILAIDAAETVN